MVLVPPGTDKNTVKNDSAQQPTVTTEQAKPEVVAEAVAEPEAEPDAETEPALTVQRKL